MAVPSPALVAIALAALAALGAAATPAAGSGKGITAVPPTPGDV
jgi:hypothetical protein